VPLLNPPWEDNMDGGIAAKQGYYRGWVYRGDDGKMAEV